MICYVTAPETTRFRVSEFLFEYAPALAPRVRFMDMNRLLDGEWPDARTWIFIGLDTQTSAQARSELLAIEARLRSDGRRILNAPSQVLRQPELHAQLRAAGIATASDNNVTSEVGGMYHGVYRRFSVLRLGARYVTRQLQFSRDRQVLVDQALTAEETAFVGLKYPGIVLPEIVRAFEIAAIEYGQLDYALRNGKQGPPQVWDIDINPFVMPRLTRMNSLRHKIQKVVAKRVCDAYEALFK